jgi:1,2-diacylglycerol 3-beta-galactosyltransferase
VTTRERVLILTADTGGGHRAVATALAEALERGRPGEFAVTRHDPLAASRLLAGYGPLVRWAPWVWGALYHATDSRAGVALLRRLVLGPVRRSVADAVARWRPAVVVSCHPLTGQAAVSCGVAVVNVVTDLPPWHAAWRVPGVTTVRPAGTGVPVREAFSPAGPAERTALRRARGLRPDGFVAVVTGGGEGAGHLRRAACALADSGVDVVVLCGRNQRLRRRLTGRVTALGYVTDVADWLRCADIVVGKAGPGTIAEATCCGAPLALTSRLPGQERGNADIVIRAGAGFRARTVRELVDRVDRLRDDSVALDGLRAASARLGRPGAAAEAADIIATAVKEHRHG